MNAWFCQCSKAYLSHIKWLEHLKPLIFGKVISPIFIILYLGLVEEGEKTYIYMVHQTTTRGVIRMARGGIRFVHGLTKSTLITYFSGMKIDPKYAFLHAFFLTCLSCPFQNLSIWPKTHCFFQFCTFLHP